LRVGTDFCQCLILSERDEAIFKLKKAQNLISAIKDLLGSYTGRGFSEYPTEDILEMMREIDALKAMVDRESEERGRAGRGTADSQTMQETT
jgi:hypothetical protein